MFLALCQALGGCGNDNAPKREPLATDPQPPSPAPAPEQAARDENDTNTVITLCDDETQTVIAGDLPTTNADGQRVANVLMAQWKEKHPETDWEAEERKSRTFVPAADNSALLDPQTQGPGHPYRDYTEQSLENWKEETERLVVAGSKVFHSADELGSTIAVSCDMCHPNAANTHPETYPKFQTQLGRVALLRDMINWCLQHPVRAETMAADDPRMRAMEAYIISQRAGERLAYGKH